MATSCDLRVTKNFSLSQAGHNFPPETSTNDLRGLMNLNRNEKRPKLPRKLNSKGTTSLPDHFDAREQWPGCPTIGEISDQGNCGSCWAVSCVDVMSDRYCIHNYTQKKHFRVSAADILSCNISKGSCRSGNTAIPFMFWLNYGLVSGGSYNSSEGCRPYEIPPCGHHANSSLPRCKGVSDTPACVKECQEGYKVNYEADKKFGKEVYDLDNDMVEIQKDILENGPVVAGFDICEDFLLYKSGVYQYTLGRFLGGHAVRIIGWGVEDKIPYWLVANSWNSDWGEKGFFRILRGSNHLGMEEEVSAGIPGS